MHEKVKYQICPICEQEFELTEGNFHRDKSSPTGFIKRCKDCQNKYYADSRKHKWDNSKPKKVPVTGFDEACNEDIVKRQLRGSYSIYQDAIPVPQPSVER